ncbi:serine-rich coiled-coil domain-containing protein 1 [Hyla sarda]|uniref:serine-rich coiled-coil domain-containing protein 1 n=1 Tax=Hyla sarda TaxID=327740 RepID=UPI0024C443C2|nr:serine-rich coiled-coil domain-containing protein 1 [Hyla sarda]XP_056423543.1 serine-rich coiled-coil domain-containing protein 1 [Hyla sarda]XP_056423553.1 serine-rich coiled-coil domain-containing protein 1 [Hyla sarda]
MGDVGTKRSALVSRLPIFRRTLSRKQDSLPSSPSSNNTSGLHSSSPSSTNSSSGSTGKRRSIFRTPSLSFQHKRVNDQKYECSQGTNNPEEAQNTLKNPDLEEQVKVKLKGSTSIPGSCRKKITRSLTENFEGKKEHSSHKNVFTNCLGKSEGDDSGFIENQTRRSVKHSTRKLLPRSFSSHYRFSKHGSQCPAPSPSQTSGCKEEDHTKIETNSLPAKTVQHSSTEVTDYIEHSLQSPLISTDHTTAPQTPSDFTFMDDSASEADSLPNSTTQHSSKQLFCHPVSTSQNLASPVAVTTHEKSDQYVPEDNSQCDGLSLTKPKVEAAVERSESISSLVNSKPLLPICELSSSNVFNVNNGEQHIDKPVFQNGDHTYSTQTFPKRSEPAVYHQRRATSTMPNHHSLQESNGIASFETQSTMIHHGHSRVNYASSFSPHRDGRYSERRLRSSSEGTAGGSRTAFKPKEGNLDEGSHFRKQRTISTSSKMNSMDVLNNLGSCELDEDDLMLDLEFTEEQQLRRVCREDSYQSIVSCSAVALSHMEHASETYKSKDEEPKVSETTQRNLFLHLPKDSDPDDTKCPRVCQVPSSPSVEWPFAQEDCTGLESLPFRLMMQDCTSVKTLLLKMKRILQESSELSPSSSTTSLPISPIAERSLPFKDIMKDDYSMLKMQLKERDEHIHQLQEELKAARTLQQLHVLRQDKYTQTESLNHEVTNNVQRNSTSTEGSVYKAIRPVHCFQHYQFKTNIWTQDALH